MRYLPVLIGVMLLAAGTIVFGQIVGTAAPEREVAPPPAAGPRGVSALGRLEPHDGIRRIAGPSLPTAVVRELLVDRGDAVTRASCSPPSTPPRSAPRPCARSKPSSPTRNGSTRAPSS